MARHDAGRAQGDDPLPNFYGELEPIRTLLARTNHNPTEYLAAAYVRLALALLRVDRWKRGTA